jgi:hypothetical protein
MNRLHVQLNADIKKIFLFFTLSCFCLHILRSQETTRKKSWIIFLVIQFVLLSFIVSIFLEFFVGFFGLKVKTFLLTSIKQFHFSLLKWWFYPLKNFFKAFSFSFFPRWKIIWKNLPFTCLTSSCFLFFLNAKIWKERTTENWIRNNDKKR